MKISRINAFFLIMVISVAWIAIDFDSFNQFGVSVMLFLGIVIVGHQCVFGDWAD